MHVTRHVVFSVGYLIPVQFTLHLFVESGVPPLANLDQSVSLLYPPVFHMRRRRLRPGQPLMRLMAPLRCSEVTSETKTPHRQVYVRQQNTY